MGRRGGGGESPGVRERRREERGGVKEEGELGGEKERGGVEKSVKPRAKKDSQTSTTHNCHGDSPPLPCS